MPASVVSSVMAQRGVVVRVKIGQPVAKVIPNPRLLRGQSVVKEFVEGSGHVQVHHTPVL